jgi:hypothetical protein
VLSIYYSLSFLIADEEVSTCIWRIAIPSGLHSNPVEFDGIKTGVIELLPNTKKFYIRGAATLDQISPWRASIRPANWSSEKQNLRSW